MRGMPLRRRLHSTIRPRSARLSLVRVCDRLAQIVESFPLRAAVQASLLLAVTLVGPAIPAGADAPRLYRQASYESPVTGAPDDLLLIAGDGLAAGDTVVYRRTGRVEDPAKPTLPAISNADFGIAPIVSSEDVPYALTVRLPRVIRADDTYALWVRTPDGHWSLPLWINDARPLWMTPAFVYTTTMPAGLPREIKIVGRNLQPSAGQRTRIRVIGPQTFTGPAVTATRERNRLAAYVARLALPGHLDPGRYRVLVNRDGARWVELPGQRLDVLPDPRPGAAFAIDDPRFGGCHPDDGKDDAACIARAISAAHQAGGGAVTFGAGIWNLANPRQPGVVAAEGILVPAGVRILGEGAGRTILRRERSWNDPVATPAFTLVGHTTVAGFTFQDAKAYRPGDAGSAFLQIGEVAHRAHEAAHGRSAVIDRVIISRDLFDKTYVAIGSTGLPIDHLFITHDTFGAYASALELAGNRFDTADPFRIDDSVIADNVFDPGSALDVAAKTGTIASELGAGERVDFSGNLADGTSTDYLQTPDDARGWRAAFFWNMAGNIEKTLVSENRATCTGDKIGDGEAFAFDDNANTFAFGKVAVVARATSTSVTVTAPLAARQNGQAVPIGRYYVGHWIQIVAGPGRGQVRRIIGYFTDPTTHRTRFRVSPNWDVEPAAGRSRIAVGREFWQLYVLANVVDNRRPPCRKSNRSRLAAGGISLWAQAADSVIAGNRQYDSDGIFAQENYIVPEHPCADCTMESFFQSFIEIRNNLVDGEYDWSNDCSASGIGIGIAAAPWGDPVPPTVGFGIDIADNTIRHADGLRGGAISQVNSWWPGPKPYRWPLSDDAIIQHNTITDVEGKRALPICGTSHPRTGIAFPKPAVAWRTVLYANTCKRVSDPIGTGGVETVKVCPSHGNASCECAAIAR